MSNQEFESLDYMSSDQSQVSSSNSQLASRGLRFGGYLLDSLLMIVTLFVGWGIWSLVVWGRGQTPAKQILKMRVIDEKTGKAAEWGRMAIREFVIPFVYAFAYIFLLLISGSFESLINGGTNWYILILQIISIVISLTDVLWITRPEHKRLTDVIARTRVVKEQ